MAAGNWIYIHPEGCDYNSHPQFEGDRGTCVCALDWGHNATAWERYQQSAPPPPPKVCTYVFNTACGCQQQFIGPFPPLHIYRLPMVPIVRYGPEPAGKHVDYDIRYFELVNVNTEGMMAFYQEKR